MITVQREKSTVIPAVGNIGEFWYGQFTFQAWHKPIVPLEITQDVLNNAWAYDWYGPVPTVEVVQ